MFKNWAAVDSAGTDGALSFRFPTVSVPPNVRAERFCAPRRPWYQFGEREGQRLQLCACNCAAPNTLK
jgi:hypothetical protein